MNPSNPTPQPTPEPYWICRCGTKAYPLTDDTECLCKDIYDQEWTRVPPMNNEPTPERAQPMKKQIARPNPEGPVKDVLVASPLSESGATAMEPCPECGGSGHIVELHRNHVKLADCTYCEGRRELVATTSPIEFNKIPQNLANLSAAESGATEGNTATALPPIPEPNTNYVDIGAWNLGCRESQLRDALSMIGELEDQLAAASLCEASNLTLIEQLETKLAASLKPEPTGAQGRADGWISVKSELPSKPDELLLTLECGGERWVRLGEYLPEYDIFEMSGGDWDAKFSGPEYSRHGMGYSEEEGQPLVYVRAWMLKPKPAASLTPSETVSPQPQADESERDPKDALRQCIAYKRWDTEWEEDVCTVPVECLLAILGPVSESPLPQPAFCPRCGGSGIGPGGLTCGQCYARSESPLPQPEWKSLSVTAIAAENPSVAEYIAELESQQKNMAMLIRTLCWRCRDHEKSADRRARSLDYLQRKGLTGTPLRMEEA